jgi:hypothetical protein
MTRDVTVDDCGLVLRRADEPNLALWAGPEIQSWNVWTDSAGRGR